MSEQPHGVKTEVPGHTRKPYRWGYFQGVFLIPFSLLLQLGVAETALRTHDESWFELACSFLMGALGVPLAVGLVRKKPFAVPLVYVQFALSLLLVLIKVPVAMKHFADVGDRGSVVFEAEMLLMWSLSVVYYRKRRFEFGCDIMPCANPPSASR